ncbi:MAG: hypothetical protein HY791_18400 [Deltaproteobacteria bacterium]|nr:hypothetical protein [Deltaproteobacteria bacterium]
MQVLLSSAILGAMACSGGVTCSGCGGAPLGPIPGGFDPAAQINLGIQARLTNSGAGFIGSEFPDLVRAYARMKCGPSEEVDCPDRFRDVQGAPAPTSCDPVELECVGPTGSSEPVLGFPIDRTESSGAIVCRDQPTDPIPSVRECAAWLRLEGLQLSPLAPNQVRARVTVQIYTTQIPFRYDPLNADCLLEVDSSRGSSRLQDFEVTAELRPYAGPDGGQLEVAITDVATPSIENEDLTIQRDPVQADGLEIFCRVADIPQLQPLIVGIFARQLGDILDTEIRKALGWRCGRADDLPCPRASTCNSKGYCENGSGLVVPQKLGTEGRLDFATLLGGLAPPTLGSMDISFLVGGQQSADAQGVTLGIRSGMEAGERDLGCALDLPSPRTRPGFSPPATFPVEDKVDLDFDGARETPFMVAAAMSDVVLDQAMWSAYSSGLFCQTISSYDIDLLNTGSMAVVIPSLRLLTHQDLDPRSIWPAAIRMAPGGEPRLRIGAGHLENGEIVEPLLTLEIPRMHMDFSAMVEERWVHLMTVESDLQIPLGLETNPANELEIVLGEVTLVDPQVTRSEILAETPEELEDSFPMLIGTALSQLSGSLAAPFGLPSGSELGGFTMEVLGIRGVDVGGRHRFVAAYADLGFDASLAPALSYAVETHAKLERLVVPPSAEMSIARKGGPIIPTVELGVPSESETGRPLEHQVRLDGGAWSFFSRGSVIGLNRPELLIQGVHELEVRSREVGRYRTLDATPVKLTIRIDTEPPVLSVREADQGATIDAFDVVSGENVQIEVVTSAGVREGKVGFVAIEELGREGLVEVRAIDEAGLVTSVVLQPAVEPQVTSAAGCRCTASPRPESGWLLAIFAMLLLSRVARTRRAIRSVAGFSFRSRGPEGPPPTTEA